METARLDFVKTSNGFSKAGATVANDKLMKATVGERTKVKADMAVVSVQKRMYY
ncbi:hypothetical protein [Spiroplasma endosymbiont of Polydrusus formosus]|uniref:hypothetical protein n=1 Tax=Spiroplasma endosymbiont of Polydrusus formosus TaxID=3139326 RepID=UPI0035B50A87